MIKFSKNRESVASPPVETWSAPSSANKYFAWLSRDCNLLSPAVWEAYVRQCRRGPLNPSVPYCCAVLGGFRLGGGGINLTPMMGREVPASWMCVRLFWCRNCKEGVERSCSQQIKTNNTTWNRKMAWENLGFRCLEF